MLIVPLWIMVNDGLGLPLELHLIVTSFPIIAGLLEKSTSVLLDLTVKKINLFFFQ